jgi:hypothetical protein
LFILPGTWASRLRLFVEVGLEAGLLNSLAEALSATSCSKHILKTTIGEIFESSVEEMVCGHSAHCGIVADDVSGAGDVVFNIGRGNGRQTEMDKFAGFFLFYDDDTVGI